MYREVYIIDDDEVSTFLTEAVLTEESFAHKYACFNSGKEALAKLISILVGQNTDTLPDLVLLDLNMPMLSGWDFLEALAPYSEQLQQRSSIYILSSSVDEEEVEQANQNKLVSGFLLKPLMEDSIRQLKHAR